jgi:ABC-2 type transport system ATP-binding protein
MIKTEGLTKSFGKVVAVAGVDLHVDRGQVLALLGPNGAGKTTIVRMLSTLVTPSGGRALVGGHDAAREPRSVRSLIGLAGQSASIDEKLTAVQNLTMLGRLHRLSARTAKARAAQLIEGFDLTAAADRPAQTYSGGMRRKLDLAASLIMAPPVLFLDEPTTGLDPVSRNGLWDVVRDLVRAGTTVLLTTQYLDEADRLADRVAVIDQGRVVADSTAQRLKDRIGTTGLAVVGADAAAFEQLRRVHPDRVTTVEPEAYTVVYRIEDTGAEGMRDLNGMLAAILEAEVAIDGFDIRRPTLDDAFLQLIGHHGAADHAVSDHIPSDHTVFDHISSDPPPDSPPPTIPSQDSGAR